jgi:hypothetical protein
MCNAILLIVRRVRESWVDVGPGFVELAVVDCGDRVSDGRLAWDLACISLCSLNGFMTSL